MSSFDKVGRWGLGYDGGSACPCGSPANNYSSSQYGSCFQPAGPSLPNTTYPMMFQSYRRLTNLEKSAINDVKIQNENLMLMQSIKR
jgi:hypothetical protein